MLKKIVVTFIFLILFFFAAIGWLGYSHAGSAWVFAKVEQASAGKFHAETFQGNLLDAFQLKNIRLQVLGQTILIEQVNFQWKGVELLRAHLHIDALTLKNIRWFADPENHFDMDEVTAKAQGSLSHYTWSIQAKDALAAGRGNYRSLLLTTLKGQWNLKNLDVFGVKFGVIQANADVGGQDQDFVFHFLGKNISFKDQQLSSVLLDAKGSLQQQNIQGTVQNEMGTISFLVNGSFQQDAWQASLEQLNVQPQNFLPWHLKTIVPFEVKKNAFSLPAPMCLVQSAQSICLTWQDKNLSIDIQHGSFYDRDYNLTLSPITLKLAGDPRKSIHLTGRVYSGTAFLDLAGELQTLFTQPTLTVQVKGENFLASDLPMYQVWASPDLNFVYENARLKFSGNLLIPKARLNLVDADSNGVTLTSDVQYVGEKENPLLVLGKITLKLGEDVTLKYGGLTGNLQGSLDITQPENGIATAIGKIHLKNGEYHAYGQTLSIQKGEAIFKGGEVDNPLLNIQAVKVLKNIAPSTIDGAIVPGSNWVDPQGTLTVGVAVTGPLLQHQVKMFSDPPGLSQSDILSYLILGVPASQAGSGGGQLLLSAASALGDGSKTSTVAQLQNELKNKFGIEVGVGNVSQYNPSTQSVTQGTALILTKTLSPKLFLTYSAGVGSTVSTVRVRYQITPSWMAQSESSTLGNGGDLYYTIDRG